MSHTSLSTNVSQRKHMKTKLPKEIVVDDYEENSQVTHQTLNRKSNRLSNGLNTSGSDNTYENSGRSGSHSSGEKDSRHMKRSDSYKGLTGDCLSPKG